MTSNPRSLYSLDRRWRTGSSFLQASQELLRKLIRIAFGAGFAVAPRPTSTPRSTRCAPAASGFTTLPLNGGAGSPTFTAGGSPSDGFFSGGPRNRGGPARRNAAANTKVIAVLLRAS